MRVPAPDQWYSLWVKALSLPESVPHWMVATLIIFLSYALVIIPSGAILSYLDRKITADFQARVGPNRAGPAGIFQPVADLFKLLQKEVRSEWKWGEIAWFGLHTMALYSTVAVLPLGSSSLLVNTDMSAFLPFWSALVLALGVMLLGFNQGTVSGWFGGVRIAAQTLAGSFPALVSLLCAGIRAGGFRWSQFAGSQGSSPIHWAAFSNPFEFLALLVFLISGLVLLGIPPMDGGFQSTDLNGGVSSHLSGYRLSLFRLGRFYGFFLWSVITVVLFMGAWNLPPSLAESLKDAESFQVLQVLELLFLLLKTFGLMTLVIWAARVNPRSRVDQVTDFSWKVLSPFSLGALIGCALWVAWGSLV